MARGGAVTHRVCVDPEGENRVAMGELFGHPASGAPCLEDPIAELVPAISATGLALMSLLLAVLEISALWLRARERGA